VILHLPPPVKSSFLPGTWFFSITTTVALLCAANIADISPAGPAPITQTSVFIVAMSLAEHACCVKDRYCNSARYA